MLLPAVTEQDKRVYRLQILALAFLAVIKAIQQADLWFLGVALILIIQFIIIEPLVAGVTNVEPRRPGQSFRSFLRERLDIVKARSIWLESSPENRPNANIVRANPLTPLTISGVLVIVAILWQARQCSSGKLQWPGSFPRAIVGWLIYHDQRVRYFGPDDGTTGHGEWAFFLAGGDCYQ